MPGRPHLIDAVATALRRNSVAAVLGPRQCGKTTLARQVIAGRQDAAFFDLEEQEPRH